MKEYTYSYDKRVGVRVIEWNDFHAICKGLSIEIAKYNPDILIGILRGGVYGMGLLSHILQKELYPIRVTRRVKDKVIYTNPKWLIKPPITLVGKKVLIVDEICDSGETLELVKKEIIHIGARNVRTCVLYSHKRASDIPDYIGIITDELIVNPWDREIFKKGKFLVHPEYKTALTMQGRSYTLDLIPGIQRVRIAKAPRLLNQK